MKNGDGTASVQDRDHEATSRAILRAIPDIMFRMNKRGVVLDYHASQADALYVPPDEIIGKPLDALLPAHVAAAALRCLVAAVEHGGVQSLEYVLPFSSGPRHYEARLVATGVEDHVLAIVRDITDRKHAEIALRQSELQYRMLLERASDALVISNQGGNILTVNRRACSLLGYSEKELMTMRVIDLLGEPGDLADIDTGESVLEERRMRCKDGREVYVELSATVMPDGRMLAILRDITERRRSEEALRRSEASFRRLIERSPGLIAVHRNGQFVYANEATARALGYDRPEDLVGKSGLEMVHPDDRELVLARLRHQADTGESVPIAEERYFRRDGTVAVFELAGIPLEFQGAPSTILIGHDITERKRAEQERREFERSLQHRQKLESLGVLAGGIAHDFNNLLMGVLGNAGLALTDLPGDSVARTCVERIEIAGRRAAELTRQLLAYSGKGMFVVQKVDLSTLVAEMLDLLDTVISKKAVLHPSFRSGMPAVEADATQMRQVVMNLITNASDALGDTGGEVRIGTGTLWADREYLATTLMGRDLPEGEYAYVEVCDTGCGMTADTLARIFDPFFTTKFTGRGLGLAAVVGIVRSHRGAILVESEPGGGSRFRVLLPVVDATPDADSEPLSPDPQWTGHGAILVIDDEEMVRSVAAVVLQRQGFEALSARDGEEGVSMFRSRAGDVRLVLLDMTMPRMGGEEAFGELRRIRPDVPILLSSGYNEQDAVERLAGHGYTGFIQKPYTPTELMARIAEILGL